MIFAAGGTGGHLYPALAVADEVRRRWPEAVITFIGARGKIEERVVPAHGYPFVGIPVSAFKRRLSVGTLVAPVKLAAAVVKAVVVIMKRKPGAVIGTGGFVCAPVIMAAQVLGIPTILQEQNSFPGVTTRVLARWATEVHLTFEGSQQYFKRRDNIRISGNPTRAEIGSVGRADGAAFFGIDPARKTVLVFGGSQGAASINAAMLPLAAPLAGEGIQIIWQTGNGEFDGIQNAMRPVERLVRVHAFIDKMAMAYAACDLAVCRSGATTIAELTRIGIPALYIPYPFAAADHQSKNAREAAGAGAAILIEDRDAARRLPTVIRELLGDTGRLNAMAESSRRLGRPGATGLLADAALRLALGRAA